MQEESTERVDNAVSQLLRRVLKLLGDTENAVSSLLSTILTCLCVISVIPRQCLTVFSASSPEDIYVL
jgi:hypothetical protein